MWDLTKPHTQRHLEEVVKLCTLEELDWRVHNVPVGPEVGFYLAARKEKVKRLLNGEDSNV